MILYDLLNLDGVTVPALVSSGVGKVVRRLRDSKHEGIASKAGKLVVRWKRMVVNFSQESELRSSSPVSSVDKTTSKNSKVVEVISEETHKEKTSVLSLVDKRYICKLCKKPLSTKELLAKHMKSHKKIVIECIHCKTIIEEKLVPSLNAKFHEPVICDFYSKTLPSRVDLLRHTQNLHSREKKSIKPGRKTL